MTYTSRLPELAAQLGARMDIVAKTTAERIEAGAKANVVVNTGKLRDAIHVERLAIGEHTVIAGNAEVFYGHIVEHGGAYTPARPFLTPAIEAVRPEIERIGREALGSL